MTGEKIALAILLAYLAGIPATWGYIWQRLPTCIEAPDLSTEQQRNDASNCHGVNGAFVFFGSIFWPIYAVGKLTIEITK